VEADWIEANPARLRIHHNRKRIGRSFLRCTYNGVMLLNKRHYKNEQRLGLGGPLNRMANGHAQNEK